MLSFDVLLGLLNSVFYILHSKLKIKNLSNQADLANMLNRSKLR